jgi:predicted RNA methylase
MGQFATPPQVALDMAEYARQLLGARGPRVRFLDPAVGTGALFSATARVFGPRLASALGVEVDPEIAAVARRIWGPHGLRVITADFTARTADGPGDALPNLIIANPPYVRHHYIGPADKSRLRAAVADSLGLRVSGLAGLYVYFVLLASQWLAEGGLGLWLVPAEFLDVGYGEPLRKHLSTQVTLVRIHRFRPEDLQFRRALVSSAIVVLRRGRPPAGHTVELSYGGTLGAPDGVRTIAAEDLSRRPRWGAALAGRQGGPGAADASAVALGDLFTIRRGIATGANRFFILTRKRAAELELPPVCLKPILPSPRYLGVSVVEADADGYPSVQPQLCLLDCDLPESLVEHRYPHLWRYLRSGAAMGLSERYLARCRRPWYRQEQRAPAPFLCTYMGRGAGGRPPIRFISNRSTAVAPNVYLMMYPRGELAHALRGSAQAQDGMLRALATLSDRCLEEEGRAYGGGLRKIEPRELARVRLTGLADVLAEVAHPQPRLAIE